MSLLKLLGIDKYTTRLKEWVNSQIDKKHAEFIGAAPEQLNTINELAAALGNDENFATTITGALAKKAEKTDIVQADYIEPNISNKSYIINKPCSIDYITISDNPVISDMSVSGFENSETYEVSIQYYNYMNIIGLCYEHNGYNGMVYVPIKYGEITTFYQTLYNKGNSYMIIIKIDAAYGPMGVRQIKVKSGSKITKIIGVAGFNKIDENFIPTTIARQSEITRLENRIAELENTINILTQNSKLDSATLDNLQLV